MAVTTREPDKVVRLLQPWLEGRHPGARIAGIEVPKLGASSETYLLDVELGGAVRHWVLRVEASGNQVYQDASVVRQYRMMAELGQTGLVPVPALPALEEDAAVLGQPFFLMERVAGQGLGNDYHVAGFLQALPVADRRAAWTNAVRAMADLHAAPPKRFGFLAWPGGGDAIGQELARWDAYRAWIGLGVSAVIDEARGWLEAHRPPPQAPGLAWGDARIDNLIFAGTEVVAVLDFETASLGGAESDLGWWIYFDRLMTEGVGMPWLEGLGRPEELVATWEGFAKRSAIQMDWHCLHAAWRFALIMGRAQALARGTPGDPACWSAEGNLATGLLARILGDVT
jgi:aminoglycoside phosphotransferase (APT) family kinase protein